ncbi:MAG: GIY-YIG nuclease family protein [bacterium]|nr:GIY-YIG nuclease family protein [bacterium]
MTRKELNKYKLPDSPGVYFFRGSSRKILYIGKATSLRDRVRSYFSANLADARSSAIIGMIGAARFISWQKTDSVLEALILEANLIKQHQPPYNIDNKDNKSFNYLIITKEDFPRVLVIRGRELFGLQATGYLRRNRARFRRDFYSLEYQGKNRLLAVFGPYPQGGSLKEALKIVRKIFPFRDSCTPCDIPREILLSNSHELDNSKSRVQWRGDTSQARSHLACRPCFNRQIGLCPGVCTGEMNKREYGRVIRHIRTLFSGKVKTLKRMLQREMRAEAKAEHYEKAQELRRQIGALEHIRDVSLIKDENRLSSGGPSVDAEKRIEAYDVAHTSGTETVAVMTVVNNGESEKESYRKFKIKTVKNDDVGALREALSRRLAHNEWPLPRVFVVDGGTAQLRAATKVLKDAGLKIPIVAVVKNEFHKPERLLGDAKAIEAHGKEILLANQEAHRFAVNWHRRRMRRSI